MAIEWFFETPDGDVRGPLRASDLLKQIRSGAVNQNTPLRKGDSHWVPAIEVNGLFEAAYKDHAAFHCPFCSEPIEKPPCNCGSCSHWVDESYMFEAASFVSRDGMDAADEVVDEAAKKVGGWAKSIFGKKEKNGSVKPDAPKRSE